MRRILTALALIATAAAACSDPSMFPADGTSHDDGDEVTEDDRTGGQTGARTDEATTDRPWPPDTPRPEDIGCAAGLYFSLSALGGELSAAFR